MSPSQSPRIPRRMLRCRWVARPQLHRSCRGWSRSLRYLQIIYVFYNYLFIYLYLFIDIFIYLFIVYFYDLYSSLHHRVWVERRTLNSENMMYTVYQVRNSCCYPLHLDCSRCPPARRWAPGGRRGSRGCSPCCRHRTGPCNCHHHYYIYRYYTIITLPVPDKVGEERLRPVPGAVPLVTRRPVVVSLQLGRLVTNTHLAINIFTTLKYF